MVWCYEYLVLAVKFKQLGLLLFSLCPELPHFIEVLSDQWNFRATEPNLLFQASVKLFDHTFFSCLFWDEGRLLLEEGLVVVFAVVIKDGVVVIFVSVEVVFELGFGLMVWGKSKGWQSDLLSERVQLFGRQFARSVPLSVLRKLVGTVLWGQRLKHN